MRPTRGAMAALMALAVVGGCDEPRPSGPAGRLDPGPQALAGSPLYVHFPELDHRIVAFDPATGAAQQAYYPDRWDPRAEFVRDFAVGKDGLYALLGGRRMPRDTRLYAVDPGSGALQRAVPLPPEPDILRWDCGGRLLVGHGTPSGSGPPGQLSRVEPGRFEVTSVALAGACSSIVPAGEQRALVLTRALRGGEDGPFASHAVAEVDLGRGRVLRRQAVAQGARQLEVGPSGLLYVSHASGPGTMATDGSISVIRPRTLELVRRLRLQMVVRRMLGTPRHLLLNLLSRTGEPWIEIQGPANTTLEDFRMPELVGAELAALGDVLYVPRRREPTLVRIDVARRRSGGALELQVARTSGEQPGMIRTWRGCDAR